MGLSATTISATIELNDRQSSMDAAGRTSHALGEYCPRVLSRNPPMLDRIAQLGERLLELLIRRDRDLLRQLLGERLPILLGEDGVIGGQCRKRAPDHHQNVGLR